LRQTAAATTTATRRAPALRRGARARTHTAPCERQTGRGAASRLCGLRLQDPPKNTIGLPSTGARRCHCSASAAAPPAPPAAAAIFERVGQGDLSPPSWSARCSRACVESLVQRERAREVAQDREGEGLFASSFRDASPGSFCVSNDLHERAYSGVVRCVCVCVVCSVVWCARHRARAHTQMMAIARHSASDPRRRQRENVFSAKEEIKRRGRRPCGTKEHMCPSRPNEQAIEERMNLFRRGRASTRRRRRQRRAREDESASSLTPAAHAP
jgi:hypothetical protein